MIASLRGTVVHYSGTIAIIDVNGVGYEVYGSSACLARCVLGSEVLITIHTEVQEGMIRLYGFNDELEKQVFLLLTRVKGVGARSSSDIVSKVDKIELLRLIAAGDLEALQKIKGIGKKTAERIIVELKDKVGEYVIEGRGGSSFVIELEVTTPFDEAIQALMALGFQRKEAEVAVKKVEQSAPIGLVDAGAIVREALQFV